MDTSDIEIDLLEYIKDFQTLKNSVREFNVELNKKLSVIDQKVSDIMHYIELYEVDDEKAKELLSELQSLRDDRRIIKTKMNQIKCFEELYKHSTPVKIQSCIGSIECYETKEYHPRHLKELYEQANKRKRISKLDIIKIQNENLKNDISKIDNQIKSLLKIVEEQNFNIVVNYRLFLRLKQLLVQRREFLTAL